MLPSVLWLPLACHCAWPAQHVAQPDDVLLMVSLGSSALKSDCCRCVWLTALLCQLLRTILLTGPKPAGRMACSHTPKSQLNKACLIPQKRCNLGHKLLGDCIKPQEESVGRILNTERPKTKKSCRSLLGIINFYRRYIPNCAEVISPLTELTKHRAPNYVEWGAEQERAFKEVKKILSSEPILKLPDLNHEIILSTDASNKSLGACMMQEYDGIKHPVMYASKKLLPREQNYSVGEREALAIVWAVNKFHRYLYGQHFTLESDHRPLEYLQTSHSKNPRIMRWSLSLQPYHYTVRYIKGSDNIIADYLSRSRE